MSRLLKLSPLSLMFVLYIAGCQFVFDRELEPGDIRGTLVVVDESGNRIPAAGALVALDNAPVVVRADATGRFVVRGLPFGSYSLRISWTPATAASGEAAALRLRDIDLSERVGAIDFGTLEIGGLGAVTGVVLGDEDDVHAVLEGVGRIEVKDGAFAFGELAAGVYEVALVGERGVWSGGSVTVKARTATPVRIDTREPPITIGSITGQVRRSDGGSLTTSSVFLAGAGMTSDAFDASGRWSMASVTAGLYTLVASAPGMLTTQVPFVLVAGATVAPDLVLVPLGAGCALGGNEAGDPTDADADGVSDADEPDVCLCHPGHADTNEDGACDEPVTLPVPACRTNDDCVGNADGELCSVSRGRCVECHGSEDCEPGEFCNVASACEQLVIPPECTTNDDCQDNAQGPVCVTDTGFCAQCLENGDCDPGHSCEGNFCEAIVTPAECGTNDDCVGHANGEFCLTDAGLCVECLDNLGCDLGQLCNATNLCETPVTPAECETNDDCFESENGPFCLPDAGVCVECLITEDCFRGECRSNNTCGPPPECTEDVHCLENPNGERCLASDYVCVECLENSDCPSGICNEELTCEPVVPPAECESNDACVGHANGAICLEPEGICVECLEDLDCGGGTCGDDHLCVADDWSIELDVNLVQQGSHVLATLGSTVILSVSNAPVDATVDFISVGSLTVETEAARPGEFKFLANAIGTVVLEVSVTLAGEATPELRYLVIQVLHDPDRAVFFDPVLGDDVNGGTLDEPKKDPAAYLAAMTAATTRRHLYVRAGAITLPEETSDVVIDSATAGTEPIIVTGGYDSDADWTRSAAWVRTSFVQSGVGSESRFLITGASTDVVLDGIVIDNQEGVVCTSGATLRLLNSQVVARNGRALETNDCQGLAAGNILMAGENPSLDSAIMFGQAMGPASTFRLMHNLVHAPMGKPFTRNGLLGGDVRFNVFLQDNNDFSIDAALELDGNSFETLTDDPLGEADRLSLLNHGLLPQEHNREVRCTDVVDLIGVANLRDFGSFAMSSSEACIVRAPLPVLNDAISDYALRYDRAGTFRSDGGRNRGPEEAGMTEPRHQAYTSSTNVVLTVGVPYVVQGLTTSTAAVWESPQIEGMDLVNPTFDPLAGTYEVVAAAVGSAALRLNVRDTDSGALTSTVIRFDVRPNGSLVFVDFNAAVDGDGTELSPRNVWPTTLPPGTDVLVAEASTSAGARLTPGWLPDGVRVFGGYARDVDGRFFRRLSIVETNLRSATATITLQIEAGDPEALPTTRVVDGVTFTSSSSTRSALVINGPLLLTRSRIENQYATAPAVLEVVGPAENVAVVGSAIAYKPNPNATSAIELVRLHAGAAPTFLFNDLYRGYSMSGSATGSAFKVTDDTVVGTYGGNRYWIDNMGSSTYVFFDASSATAFSPSVLAGNAYAERGSTSISATNIGTGDWDALAATEDYANGWGDGCASPWSFGTPWASAARGDCPDAYDSGQRATALESALNPEARIGVDFDHLGRQRKQMGATMGATQALPGDEL